MHWTVLERVFRGEAWGQEVTANAERPVREAAANRERVLNVATRRQTQAAQQNVKKAQSAARKKRTIAHLPTSARSDLGRQAAAARGRGGEPGRSYENRTRAELYEAARKRGIKGRSKMGKWELIEALRK
jgi:hypothetical protein